MLDLDTRQILTDALHDRFNILQAKISFLHSPLKQVNGLRRLYFGHMRIGQATCLTGAFQIVPNVVNRPLNLH